MSSIAKRCRGRAARVRTALLVIFIKEHKTPQRFLRNHVLYKLCTRSDELLGDEERLMTAERLIRSEVIVGPRCKLQGERMVGPSKGLDG